MKTILHVVGARPNFIKVAPVMSAFDQINGFNQILVHTGQHDSYEMSTVFFKELNIPTPQYHLGCFQKSIPVQIGTIISGLESILLKEHPDWVFVYGDVTSTVSGALVARQLGFKVAHIEAGLRSFDENMPEELNRRITDHMCQKLFAPSLDAMNNLRYEGIISNALNVGNVMIDSLVKILDCKECTASSHGHILVTLHRPNNVDDPAKFDALIKCLERLAVESSRTMILVRHPRTAKKNHLDSSKINVIGPLPYIEFIGLMNSSALVITDSGGVQEETTFLGIPCLTLRENTERPITTTLGTNKVIGCNPERIINEAHASLNLPRVKPTKIPLWDGKAGQRIATAFIE